MAKHVHAENMALYAQDAQETDKPWELWEFLQDCQDARWDGLIHHPRWDVDYKYRRKPKMISVTLANGEVVSWPEPVKHQLKGGDVVFAITTNYLTDPHGYNSFDWYEEEDFMLLEAGLVHLTEEAAQQHVAALRKINTQGMNIG